MILTSPQVPRPRHPILDAELLLVERQLAAMDSWHRARRLTEQSTTLRARTREQRMDVARRMETLREEHRVIIERTERSLALSLQRARRPTRRTVLLAHRNLWLTEHLIEALVDGGADVVGTVQDGAQAVGFAIAELPDLVLVEAALPRLTGSEVIRQVRQHAPHVALAAQVDDAGGVGALLEAGARATYSRRLPPADLARELLGLLSPV